MVSYEYFYPLWSLSKFLLLLNAKVLVSVQNPPKITLQGNWRSSASIGATKVLRVPLERYWTKVYIYIKLPT